MRKYISLIMILVILIASLAGCSKTDDPELQATPETTVTEAPTVELTSEPTKEPAAEPTAEPTEEPTSEPATEPTTAPTDEAASNPSGADPKSGMFMPSYSVNTSISYSAGNDSDWSYGNQRKEFAISTPCYVRIGSSVITAWHWGWHWGIGKKITVTYRFTGVENCAVEMSDGFADMQTTNNPNVIEFTRTVEARKRSNAIEDVVIFQYTPTTEGSITLEVFYDGQVAAKYDIRNTIYFTESEDLYY